MSAFTSLRDWLRHLAQTERAAFIQPGISLHHRLAAVAKALDGKQAAIFPEPEGHKLAVVSGLVSNRAWIAESLGVSQDQLLEHFQQASLNPLPWREVEQAPAQQMVHRDVNLLKLLPLPTHAEHDSGPYISAGLLIARNPQTGIQNVSINRCQASGPDRLGVLILPRHANHYYEIAEAAGQSLPVAVVIGVNPPTLLSSQAIAPLDQDELEIAGSLCGAPLEVVKCLTNEVRVPAHAEIVIEGELLPTVREPEGPFAEFPQYYGPRSDKPVIKINAITHRRNALFHTILGGGLEHLLLGAIPREATLLAHLRRSFPNVLDVHLSMGGVGRYHLYVKIKKRQEGEAKNVIMGAFGGHYDLKQVTVVDDDVDVHNPEQVEWAVATRFQADRDLVMLSGAQGSKLDPSADDGISAKMGLDATIPIGADPFRFQRTHIPGERSMNLDEFVLAAPEKDAWLKLLV